MDKQKKNDIQDSSMIPYVSTELLSRYPNYATAIVTPLRPVDVEWKVQSEKKEGGNVVSSVVVPYINSRYAYRILAHVFGLGNFMLTLREVHTGRTVEVHKEMRDIWVNKKSVNTEFTITDETDSYAWVARLSIYTSNGWCHYEDGSDETDIEPVKGGISGAYKRVMSLIMPPVMELYAYPKVEIQEKVWSSSEYEGLSAIVEMYNARIIPSSTKLIVSKTQVLHWKTPIWTAGKNIQDAVTEKQPEQKKPEAKKLPPADNTSATQKVIGKTLTIEWESADPNKAGLRTMTGTVKLMDRPSVDALIELIKAGDSRIFRNFVEVKGTSGTVIFVNSYTDGIIYAVEHGSHEYKILEKFKFTIAGGKIKK